MTKTIVKQNPYLYPKPENRGVNQRKNKMTLQRRNELIAQINKLAGTPGWNFQERDQLCELLETIVMELYENSALSHLR